VATCRQADASIPGTNKVSKSCRFSSSGTLSSGRHHPYPSSMVAQNRRGYASTLRIAEHWPAFGLKSGPVRLGDFSLTERIRRGSDTSIRLPMSLRASSLHTWYSGRSNSRDPRRWTAGLQRGGERFIRMEILLVCRNPIRRYIMLCRRQVEPFFTDQLMQALF